MALFKNKKLLAVVAAVVVIAVVATVVLLSGKEGDPSETTASTETTARQTDPTTLPDVTVPQETLPTETMPPAVWNTVPELGVSYEQWLGAAQVMAVSMEYPDFEIQGIYAASETALENHGASLGAYILFTSEGQQILIHSAPLTGERSQPGTMDLYTSQLGFATYDKVDPSSVDLAAMELLAMEELGELMDYSILVSLYGR